MFDLAQTAWPRFGGDQANRSFLRIPGPHTNPSWQKIPLPASYVARPPDNAPSGVIIMPDETLRVCHAGMLFAMTLDGTILWQLDLARLTPRDTRWINSLPTALQTGETLLFLPDALLIVDRFGAFTQKDHEVTTDDSGYSPNLTYSGLPILSAITGEVCLLKGDNWQEIGVYGYDIVTPAVYPDNSLAIVGYAGKGFCRVSTDGDLLWTTSMKEADLLPTLNDEYIAAVGSLNDKHSAFFGSDGTLIGEYPHAAIFAVYPDGGWIALSEQRLARLTMEGKEVWGREMSRGDGFSFVEQPLVDRDGFIFVRQQDGFLCCDPHGNNAFEVRLPSSSRQLMSIVAPGIMTYVMGHELFIGHN